MKDYPEMKQKFERIIWALSRGEHDVYVHQKALAKISFSKFLEFTFVYAGTASATGKQCKKRKIFQQVSTRNVKSILLRRRKRVPEYFQEEILLREP